MIGALVRKDVILFFRNQFFALVSALGLVFYALIYFIMPHNVDETLAIGVMPPDFPEEFIETAGDSGIIFYTAETRAELEAEMLDGDYNVAFVLPPQFAQRLAAGEPVEEDVTLLFTADFPADLRDAYHAILEEMAYAVGGQELKLNAHEEILGPDMARQQIPARKRMVPMFGIMILMVEMMGLASLIASEIEGRTLHAILTTPVRVRDVFLSKGLTGTALAFGQAALLTAVIGGLAHQPVIILLALLLGSLLVTGIAFLVASAARDFMSVVAWSIPAIIVLAIPTFGVLFPGLTTQWVKFLPTFWLVDVIHQTANFGAGWADVWPGLLVLVGFDVLFVALGLLALRRKMSS